MKHHFVRYPYNEVGDNRYTTTCIECGVYKTNFYTNHSDVYSSNIQHYWNVNYWIDEFDFNKYYAGIFNTYGNLEYLFGYIPDCNEIEQIKRTLILRDIME